MADESKSVKTFWLVILSGFSFFVQFLSTPFIARALTLFDNGLYHQVILITDVFFLFLALGFHNVILIYLRRSDYKKNEVFWTSLILLKVISILGIIIIYIVAPFIDMNYNAEGNLAPLLRIYSVFLLFKLPMSATEAAFIIFGKTKIIVRRNLFFSIVNAFVLIAAVQYFKSVEALIYALIFNSLTYYVVSFCLIPKDIKSNIRFSRAFLKVFFNDGLALGVNNIIGRISIMIDKLIISSLLNPILFAIYRNGAIEVPFFSSIYRTISNIAIPEMTKLISENQEEKILILKRKIIANTALIIYPVMVFLVYFSEEFIVIYLSDKYIESVPVFRIFTLTLLFRINAYGDILLAKREYKTMIKSSTILVIASTISSLLFIYFFGIIGGSIAYFLMVMTSVMILLNYSAKSIQCTISDFFNFKEILKILIVSVAFASFIFLLPIKMTYWLNFLIMFISYSIIVYFVLLKYFIKDLSVIIQILNQINIGNYNLGYYFIRIFGK